MRTEARALALIIAILAASPLALASPFLQDEGGAARTGILSDAGPATSDVAFVRSVPGGPVPHAPPIIVGHAAFVLVQVYHEGTENALVRVGLDDATVIVVTEFAATPTAMTSDGANAYVTTQHDVQAIALATSHVLWTYALPGARATCASPAVDRGALFLFCTNADESAASSGTAEGSLVATALDAATGRVAWTRALDDPMAAPGDPAGALAAAGRSMIPMRISVIGERAFFVAAASGNGGNAAVFALDRSTGASAWSKSQVLTLRDAAGTLAFTPEAATTLPRSQSLVWPSYVVGDSDEVAVGFGHTLHVFKAPSGDPSWSVDLPFPGSDTLVNDNLALCLVGNEIIAGQFSTIWTIDRGADHNVTAHDTGYTIDSFALLVANSTIYTSGGTFDLVSAAISASRQTNYSEATLALEMNGTVRWARPLPPWSADLAAAANAQVTELQQGVGERVGITIVGTNVVVLGITPASLVAHARIANAYPAVGAKAEADLSGTLAGVDGPATEFRADWGDGDATDWQPDPHLSHAYLDKADRVATFEARNRANQTATTTASYHVGAEAPVEPTLLSRALDPAYQNVTFGIVGLAATGAGGLVALFARRRRRTLLARELRALDDARARWRDDGPAWRADVAHRRAHYATLLRKRRIDSGELLVLERHIEVLSGHEPAAPAPRVEVGAVLLERYRIDRMLGEGGQGRVYLARDLTIGRDVVVKAVPTAGLGGQATRLLLAEARLAGSIDHANVVRVFDVIEAPQEAYLVLEYVDGGTLRSRLARGPIPRGEAISIFRGLLAGLA